jgi:DNA-binding PadR family transcriptional regulator
MGVVHAERSERGAVMASRHLILGVLARGAAHGYAVRRRLDALPGVRRPIESSRVYALLRELERAGQVVAREEACGGGVRRVYRLSPLGRGALDRWLVRPVRASAVTRRSLLLHLAASSAPSAAQAAALRQAAATSRGRTARSSAEPFPGSRATARATLEGRVPAELALALRARQSRVFAVEAEALERWIARAPAAPISRPRSATAPR